MTIIVQKFGGTSVSNTELRHHVIGHIKRELSQGHSLVVVVSAMGRKGEPYATDTLLDLVKDNGNRADSRSMDLLLSCGEIISAVVLSSQLNEVGIKSTVFTGGQAGIITNRNHSDAQIMTIDSKRIREELDNNKVIIVTGFQGITIDGEVTTLGRGGSDTTATALGVALGAEVVDIYTDVNGIMTADPRIVEEAAPLSAVTYAEICNMAYQGAKVIHPRAVEVAMQSNVPVRVRSTKGEDTGTVITSNEEVRKLTKGIGDRFITGIAHVPNVTQIKVLAEDGQYDLQLKVFKAMAANHISVDFINVNPLGVVYTVFDDVADRAITILRRLGYHPEIRKNCAKVSTIGAGMAGVPGIMAMIVEALTNMDIDILQSADSHTTIWVLVKNEDMVNAVRALHRKFELDKRYLTKE